MKKKYIAILMFSILLICGFFYMKKSNAQMPSVDSINWVESIGYYETSTVFICPGEGTVKCLRPR